MGVFHSKGLRGIAGNLTADQVIQLLDDEDEEMLTTCSEVDEAMLRKIVEAKFEGKGASEIGMMHNAAGTGRDAALLKAASAGHDQVVLSLVEKGANVDTPTVFGDTPLLRAAAGGHAPTVRQLLHLGAEVDHGNMAGSTALILAAARGHAAVVKELLSGGATVDLATWWGDTPLISAALHGHAAVVELLLQKGACVDARNKHGCTAVVMAARGDHCHAIDLLLEHGASIDLPTKFRDTALLKAAAAGHELAVATLLVGGADFNHRNEWGDTALTIAASRGFGPVIERLLDAGADTKLTNKDGKSALKLATAKGHKNCITLLQMADRRAMRGTEAMSFQLTYNGRRLHSEAVAQLLSLPKAEAAAVRGLSSLRDAWPLLNDLYGVNSMWQRMKVLDEAIGDYQARVNVSRGAVSSASGSRHPLNGDDPAVMHRITQAEDEHLAGLQEIYRLYKRKQAAMETRAQQVTEMKELLGDAITRSQESARADPEVLSSRSVSRQSSIANTPIGSPPGGSTAPSSPLLHQAASTRPGCGPLPPHPPPAGQQQQQQHTAGTAGAGAAGLFPPRAAAPSHLIHTAVQGFEGRLNTVAEAEAAAPATDQGGSGGGGGGGGGTPCTPAASSLLSVNLNKEAGGGAWRRPEVQAAQGGKTPATPSSSPLHGIQQVEEEPLVQTVADAEKILRVARLKLAPAMEATEAALVELFKAMQHEMSILQALNSHLGPVVDRSLLALKQVERNIDADRILADAKTSSQYAARYHDELEVALNAYGRTAESLERPSSPASASSERLSLMAGNATPPTQGGRRRSPRGNPGPPAQKQHPLA